MMMLYQLLLAMLPVSLFIAIGCWAVYAVIELNTVEGDENALVKYRTGVFCYFIYEAAALTAMVLFTTVMIMGIIIRNIM